MDKKDISESVENFFKVIEDNEQGFVKVRISHLNILKLTSFFIPFFIVRYFYRVLLDLKKNSVWRKIGSGFYFRNRKELKKNKSLLREIRKDIKYSKNPLVSVLIHTYNNAEFLTKRTIPSVLKQTYKFFEIVIVGDHCTDNTQELINKLDDKRIRFYNLPERGDYPLDHYNRWLVAGVVPVNKGLELCKGEWIAHLDHDDEFTENHIEDLLNAALENNYEMVYGKVRLVLNGNDSGGFESGSYPLKKGKISPITVLTNSKLRVFKYDLNCWKYGEPGDWNRWRRMKEAGVRIGFVNKVVSKYYIYQKFKNQFLIRPVLF